MSRFAGCLLAIALLGITCSPRPSEPQRTPSQVDAGVTLWLRTHALPLGTTEPEGQTQDLAPLRRLLGDARVVVLGEATHGTHEFFRLKHRLTEYLVRELGFSLIAWEAGGPEMDRLDASLHSTVSDPTQALEGVGYWPWVTREALEFAAWARRPPTPIHLRGIDMQIPSLAASELDRFLTAYEPGDAVLARAAEDCLRPWDSLHLRELYQRYPKFAPETQQACQLGLQNIYNSMMRKRSVLERRSSAEATNQALRNARLLVQFEQLLRRKSWRDRMMAENVEALLSESGPSTRLIVWTHNVHASNQPGRLGSYLKKDLGEKAILIALTLGTGTFRSIEAKADGHFGDLREFPVPSPPEDAYERGFGSIRIPIFLLDLRPNLTATSVWLQGPRPMLQIGASYSTRDRQMWQRTPLPRAFDLLLHVQVTTPSRGLKPPPGS